MCCVKLLPNIVFEIVMKLNLFTDIALKSLIVLQKDSDRLFKIDEVAELISAPRNHLIKVINFMVHKGWISSMRGRNGGISYNLSSDDLKLGEVISLLEKDEKEELLNCRVCKMNTNCQLRGMLGNAKKIFYDSLNQYTIKDIALIY